MQQRLTILTICVEDLGKMKNFYQGVFGWTPLTDNGSIVFFKMNGMLLGLYPASEMGKEFPLEDEGSGFKRFTLAINFKSEKEVDEAFAELESKGVKIVKKPEKVFWGGYSGYVADIEGNYWELAHNPFLELDENGNLV